MMGERERERERVVKMDLFGKLKFKNHKGTRGDLDPFELIDYRGVNFTFAFQQTVGR